MADVTRFSSCAIVCVFAVLIGCSFADTSVVVSADTESLPGFFGVLENPDAPNILAATADSNKVSTADKSEKPDFVYPECTIATIHDFALNARSCAKCLSSQASCPSGCCGDLIQDSETDIVGQALLCKGSCCYREGLLNGEGTMVLYDVSWQDGAKNTCGIEHVYSPCGSPCARRFTKEPGEQTIFLQCNSKIHVFGRHDDSTVRAQCASGDEPQLPDDVLAPSTGDGKASHVEETKPETKAEPQERQCFAGNSLVEVEGRGMVKMHSLQVGDRVRTSPTGFSEVFMFTHRQATVRSKFIQLTLDSGAQIRATPGHFVYCNGELVRADQARVGDLLPQADGSVSMLSATRIVIDEGLFNPQTLDGNIVVDGVVASTYTSAVQPWAAHAALSPARALYKALGWSVSV